MRGDRAEHGSVVPPQLADLFAQLEVVVVTQLLLVRDHGDDYFAMTDPPDPARLYLYGSLLYRGLRGPSRDASLRRSSPSGGHDVS